MKKSPLHEHDCNNCIYLGSFYKKDYYLCISKEHPFLSTFIARYGKNGNYSSGIEFCWSNIYLNIALKLAEKQNLLTDKKLRQHILNKQKQYLDYLNTDLIYAESIAKRWKKRKRFLLK